MVGTKRQLEVSWERSFPTLLEVSLCDDSCHFRLFKTMPVAHRAEILELRRTSDAIMLRRLESRQLVLTHEAFLASRQLKNMTQRMWLQPSNCTDSDSADLWYALDELVRLF